MSTSRSSILGSLLIDGSLGSSIALFHPNHFTDQYTDYDKEFKSKCCLAGLCDVFYERRPIDYSIDYQPPFFGEQRKDTIYVVGKQYWFY